MSSQVLNICKGGDSVMFLARLFQDLTIFMVNFLNYIICNWNFTCSKLCLLPLIPSLCIFSFPSWGLVLLACLYMSCSPPLWTLVAIWTWHKLQIHLYQHWKGDKGSLPRSASYPPSNLPGLTWVLCWLMFSLLSTRTPRSFSMEMLPRQLLWACTIALGYSIPDTWLDLLVEEDPVLSIPSACSDSFG